MAADRVAVITGAGGAIGAAFARACAGDGYRVVAVHRTARAGEPDALAADFESAAEIASLGERLASLEGVALLVHAAGSYERGSIEELEPERYEHMRRVNVDAAYAVTRAVLPALRASAGWIVFVNSSVVNQLAPRDVGAYAMTKSALKSLADAVRAEENRHGVGVLSVYPGRTAGTLQERLHDLEGRSYAADGLLQPGDVARAALNAIGLPPTAEVTDLHIRPRRPPS
jgi:NADP-dependent 3-hydroxy acid dehydrogenase YdfG